MFDLLGNSCRFLVLLCLGTGFRDSQCRFLELDQIFPFVVLLGKGNHEMILNPLRITRSNLTFVGTGKVTTTILGGFAIISQENITFKQMTVTHASNYCN